MIYKAYLGLGANVGDREKNIINAVHYISELENTRIVSVSQIYETEPVGYADQNLFLNMVIKIQTGFAPSDLLEKIQCIEKKLKRTREILWGPRTIDIDILIYEGLQINTPQLVVPHPRMLQRAFVLVPLRDVYQKESIGCEEIDILLSKCSDRDGVKLFKAYPFEI
ncbi:MAG: 2-amino-4-hydroxy-6-hydroxymethyldihydropteridine diphosphokinase [Clostridia bacterium]|nr:2-amino-4-hydroxy-6-hydroxymethyldihydropteridine diphosphokinase [Clostridia bacterium]